MSTAIVEGVSTSETGDETHSSDGHEPKDIKSAASKSSTPGTSD